MAFRVWVHSKRKTNTHLDLVRDTVCQLKLPFVVSREIRLANAFHQPLILGQCADRALIRVFPMRKKR